MTVAMLKRVAAFRQPAADSPLWFEDPSPTSVEGRAERDDPRAPTRMRDTVGDCFVLVECVWGKRFLPKDAVKPKPGKKPFRGPIPIEEYQVHMLSTRWRTPSILSLRVYLHQGRFRYTLSSDAAASADKKSPDSGDRGRCVAAVARFLAISVDEADARMRAWTFGS